MSFPASNTLVSDALQGACIMARRLKTQAQLVRNDSAAGPVVRLRVVDLMRQLTAGIATFNASAAVSGIGAYAQAQLGNPSLDVVAEFTVMVNAATTLRDWIFNNFPKDVTSGGWLVFLYDNAGVQTDLMFTTAQLAQFRTNVDTFVATIA